MTTGVGPRLLRNAGYLFGGRVARDALGLVALALAARHLSPAEFGVLALLQGYALTINGLVNFQSWQAVVRHGAAYDVDTDDGRTAVAGLLRFGLTFDASTAVAGALIGVAAAPLGAMVWGWDGDAVGWARLYCVVVLFDLTGTWTAALRLLDRFDLLATPPLLAAAVKLAGVAWAVWSDGGLGLFVGVWIAAELAGLLASGVLALRETARRGLLAQPWPSLGEVRQRHAGIVGFLGTTNLHGAVRLLSKEADLLLVGGLLGPAGAGLYRVMKQVASLMARAGDPLYQAVYPELARLWAAGQRDEFRRLLDRCTAGAFAVAAAALVGFALVGRQALAWALQPEYAEAYTATLIYLAASGLALASFAFHPAALAMDRPAESFGVLAVCTALHIGSLTPLTARWGLEGAALAYVLFYLAWVVTLRWRLAAAMRRS
jgi:O-antigen/teichoic acid export membrane protein